MAKTVVGLFETPTEAQNVKQQLVSQGYSSDSIRVLSNETDGFAESAVADARGTATSETGVMGSIKNFFHSLTGGGDEQDYYTKGVSAGGALLAVTVADDKADAVSSLLGRYGADDINQETATTSGRAAVGTASASASAPMAATTGRMAAGTGVAGEGDTIKVVEEELQVGKRQVQRGGVRVYSHMVETPVEEDVQLREEHVRVERVPVNRPASEADFNTFKEGTVEMTEMGEEVVVGKQARVVEEIKVGKDVSERTQKVQDTVRHTEVDVEQIAGEEYTKGTTPRKP